MKFGIFDSGAASGGRIDTLVKAAAEAQDDGFASFWLPQIFGHEALVMCAILGREVPDIALGTAVVPVYPRHPITLAAEALSVQAASHGRLTLGIGLSHQPVIEGMFGYSFARPVEFMSEYLSALNPLLRGEQAAVNGERVTANAALTVADAPAPDVLLAALGPKMIQLAARETAGTITWMTGVKTLRDYVVPSMVDAAGEGASPRVVAALPVCVTDRPDEMRAECAEAFQIYGFLPSYRAMLDREGVDGPADVALISDAGEVEQKIGEIRAAGVTEFVAVEFARDDRERRATRDLLKSLL